MTGDEKHLNIEQIECLIESQPSDAISPEFLESARQHLQECEVCRKLVSMERYGDQILRGLFGVRPASRGVDCPSESLLLELAGNAVGEEDVVKLTQHAAECDHCGPLLRDYMSYFSEITSAEEKEFVEGLASARPDWQSDLAARLSSLSTRDRRGGSFARGSLRPLRTDYRRALALAACLVLIASGWLLFRSKPEQQAERLIGKAYTERRVLEMRFPDARYGPIRVERGGSSSHLALPASLLEAEVVVGRNLALNPSDPKWLSLKGRIDLLEGNQDAAIATLGRAEEIDPQSPSIKIDLASAYFERAENGRRAVDYGSALDYLGQALGHDPNNVVALFNRAICAEKMFMYRNALDDWERYLRLDPTGQWSEEARQHASAVEQLLKNRSQRKPGRLEDPASYLSQTAHGTVGAAEDRSFDESSLEIATTRWLPNLYSETNRAGHSRESSVKAALAFLAERLETRHEDKWLKDMLASPPSRPFGSGVSALARAVQADLEGNPEVAKALATDSARLFLVAHSEAGWERARLEETYALHRSGQGLSCAAEARSLPQKAIQNHYTWLQGQSYLEQFNCFMLTGDINSAQGALNQARMVTDKYQYPVLGLRATGFYASLATQKGDRNESWAESRTGLAEFWRDSYPAVRGYHFYSELGSEEADLNHPHVSILFMQEAVGLISDSPLHSAEAEERFLLASEAERIGLSGFARREFVHSERIFASLPQDAATKAYRAEAEISLAQIEAESGQTREASERLQKVRGSLSGLSTYSVLLHFYQTSARVAILRSDSAPAERYLHAATGIAEAGLASLTNETDRLTWDRETGPIYRDLVQLVWNQGKSDRALDVWEWYRAAPLRVTAGRVDRSLLLDARAMDDGPPLPAMPEVHAVFPGLRGKTVISYALLPDGLRIWKFDDSGMQAVFQHVDTATLESVARRFAMECADPDSDVKLLKQDAVELYNWLLSPILRYIEPGRIIIVEPDGPLNLIPFQALVDPSSEFVGLHYPMVTSLGIGYSRFSNAPEHFSPEQRALIVSSPTLDRQLASVLAPLPDVSREAEAVAATFHRARQLSGDDATRDFLEQELRNTVIFHFAGHSLAKADHPYLVLAAPTNTETRAESQGSLVEASQLKKKFCQKCELVVLSACSTAVAGDGSLTDPGSLPRAILRSGVPNVVASLWDVDSNTTTEYMKAFYESLLVSNSVAIASQTASRVIRTGNNLRHPYYWAAFVAFETTDLGQGARQ